MGWRPNIRRPNRVAANELNCLYLGMHASWLYHVCLLISWWTVRSSLQRLLSFNAFEAFNDIRLSHSIALYEIRYRRHEVISCRIRRTVRMRVQSQCRFYWDACIYMKLATWPSNEKTHQPQSSGSLPILSGTDTRAIQMCFFTSASFAQMMFPHGTLTASVPTA